MLLDWQLFVSTFGLIFVAEIPDKTAFAALFLATCNNPLAVFIGAAGAFVIQSLVAVISGDIISRLAPSLVHLAAGVLFLIFAVAMWRKQELQNDIPQSQCEGKPVRFSQTVVSSFLVIFAAEWGDLTQLATATLAAKYSSPFTIFIAATLALWAVTGVGVIVGYQAKKVIDPKLFQRVAATAFALVGLTLLIKH
jgi:putative Ca2+/H+ antiporter (TMEM165/GDT1 family)